MENSNYEYEDRDQLGGYSFNPQQGNSDLVRLSLTTDDILTEVKARLLAMNWDAEKLSYIRNKKVVPPLNDEGVESLLTRLSMYLTRITALSNIGEKEIKERCKKIEHIMSDELEDHFFEWGVDKKKVPGIVDDVGNIIWVMMMRAKDGIERQQLSGGHRTMVTKQEIESSQNIREGSGGWSPFGRRK